MLNEFIPACIACCVVRRHCSQGYWRSEGHDGWG